MTAAEPEKNIFLGLCVQQNLCNLCTPGKLPHECWAALCTAAPSVQRHYVPFGTALLAQQNDPGVRMKSTCEIDSWLILALMFVFSLVSAIAVFHMDPNELSRRCHTSITRGSSLF